MKPLVSCLAAIALCGCTATWTEADGTRRILGLGVVAISIPSQTDQATFAGSAVDMTTIGLALADAGDETVLTLGYLNLNMARLRNNSLVVGDPLALRRPSPSKQ